MSEFRRDVVERVFIILDKNNEGVLDVAELKSFFNSKKHPDVMTGKKSEDTVLMEFLETFEYHYQLLGRRDGKINLDQFMEYYANIVLSIDNDETFSVMLNNVWNITGNAFHYSTYDSSNPSEK